MSKFLAIVAILVSTTLLIIGSMVRIFQPVETAPIEGINLSEDRLTVELTFVAASLEYDRHDPCTEEYEARGRWIGDILEVEVVVTKAQGHGRLFRTFGCDAIGYVRTINLELDGPFTGSEIRTASSSHQPSLQAP